MSDYDDMPDNLPATVDDTGPDSGGRLAEIQNLMAEGDHGPYWKGSRADALQKEYRDLLDRQGGDDLGKTDEGLARVEGVSTPDLADTMAAHDLSEGAARTAISTAMAIADLVPLEDRSFFDQSFGGLTDETRAAIVRELASPSPSDAEPASDSVLQTLTERGCGELLREWGSGAARAVGVANARVNNVIDSIDNDEAAEDFVVWFNGLSGGELSAILRMIA